MKVLRESTIKFNVAWINFLLWELMQKLLVLNLRTPWFPVEKAQRNCCFVYVIAWFVVIFGINTTSDISKLFYIISRAVRRVKFGTILKYHEWYLCQISRTNHAIICLYYNLRNFCNLTPSVYFHPVVSLRRQANCFRSSCFRPRLSRHWARSMYFS